MDLSGESIQFGTVHSFYVCGHRLDMASDSLPLVAAPRSQTLAADQKKDIAWEWAESNDPSRKKHSNLVGEVRGCPNATKDIIAKIREVEIIKKKQKVHMDQIDLMYATADFNGETGDDEDIEVEEVEADVVVPSKRKYKGASNVRGPIEEFMKTDYSEVQQTTLERQSVTKMKLKDKAWDSISAWMTENAIPFNTVRSPSFQVMLHSIGEYGKEEDNWLDPENLSYLIHQADEFIGAQANHAMGVSSGPVTRGR
ncbi:hypothetical protein C5167_043921 [Papaver somniferum]|uniref:Uncharacterized protein n=1 Tax=Papaver somniferum TaxID=3469 RepID=A0A4Y7LAZ0_PAPSO|nr:hypothetical protein C5167_043921 [Papaver somniferum]